MQVQRQRSGVHAGRGAGAAQAPVRGAAGPGRARLRAHRHRPHRYVCLTLPPWAVEALGLSWRAMPCAALCRSGVRAHVKLGAPMQEAVALCCRAMRAAALTAPSKASEGGRCCIRVDAKQHAPLPLLSVGSECALTLAMQGCAAQRSACHASAHAQSKPCSFRRKCAMASS